MKFRELLPVFYIALGLVAVELALEVRHLLKGYNPPIQSVVNLLRNESMAPSAQGSTLTDHSAATLFPQYTHSPPIDRTTIVPALRVWFASASYAADDTLPVHDIFAVSGCHRLTAENYRCEIVNASKAGRTISTNVLDLESLDTSHWRPDVSVLYNLSLDISDLSDIHLGGARSQFIAAQVDTETQWEAFDKTARSWLERTSIYVHSRSYIGGIVILQGQLATKLPATAISDYRKRVLSFIGAARAVNSIPVLSTFAFSEIDTNKISFQSKIWMLRYNLYLSPEGWISSVDQLNDETSRIAGEQGIPLIPFASMIGGKAESFRDPVHFTRTGHDEMSKVFAESLYELFLKPKESEE